MSEAQATELDAVGLCLALHDAPDSIAWDHVWPKGLGVVAHKRFRDTDVIVWRGSLDPLDWYADLDACSHIVPGLGRVHSGFWSGVFWRKDDVLPICGLRVIVAGHSLGAAEAALFAGVLTSQGRPPKQVYLYGCPRPGMQKLCDVLAPVAITSRKNLNDPVTRVPWDIPLFDPFMHVRPQIEMAVQPPASDNGFFREHHCNLYYVGVKALA